MPNPPKKSSYSKAGKLVAHKIHEIEHSKTEGLKKARLAWLRRGLGKTIDEVPELWELILEDITDSDDDSTQKFVVEGAYEEAIYGALTLYGLAHQKANDTPHKEGISFGFAVGKLVAEDESNRDRIGTRLKSVLKAKNSLQATIKMRPLISLLSKENESFDFAQLADDLYWLAFPTSRKKVRLDWAREYIRGMEEKKAQKSKDKGEKDYE